MSKTCPNLNLTCVIRALPSRYLNKCWTWGEQGDYYCSIFFVSYSWINFLLHKLEPLCSQGTCQNLWSCEWSPPSPLTNPWVNDRKTRDWKFHQSSTLVWFWHWYLGSCDFNSLQSFHITFDCYQPYHRTSGTSYWCQRPKGSGFQFSPPICIWEILPQIF